MEERKRFEGSRRVPRPAIPNHIVYVSWFTMSHTRQSTACRMAMAVRCEQRYQEEVDGRVARREASGLGLCLRRSSAALLLSVVSHGDQNQSDSICPHGRCGGLFVVDASLQILVWLLLHGAFASSTLSCSIPPATPYFRFLSPCD